MGSLVHIAALSSLLLLLLNTHESAAADPTTGFTELPLDPSKNFNIQKPYDLDESQRYSFIDGVHKLWVYSTDKPFKPDSNTKPRTEIRIRGYDYSSGVWQFQAYVYVPSGTSAVSIFQAFDSSVGFPTLMLMVYGGSLKYFNSCN